MNAILTGREAVDAYEAKWCPPETDVLREYWRDPIRFETERRAGQAEIDLLFANHRARVRAAQEARWAAEEAAMNRCTALENRRDA